MKNWEQAEELSRRLQRIGRAQIDLDARDLWVVLAAMQLSWRHPGIGDALKERLWDLGHQLTRLRN